MHVRLRTFAAFTAGVLCSVALPAMAAKGGNTVQTLRPVLQIFMTREDVAAMIAAYDQEKVEPVRADQQTLQEQMDAVTARVSDLEARQEEEEEPVGLIGDDPVYTCSTDTDCSEGYVCEIPAPNCGPNPTMCAEGSEACIDVVCVSAPPHCVPGS
jgi:hypothetical protein